jgi:DNA-binding LytR/AlgR family response regulator
MNIIIIEDEPLAATELVKMISLLDPDTDVITVLGSVSESLNWFRSNPMPDLIFSDIYLSDGTSFDIFRELEDYAPVIFCTAYDQHALEAFNSNAIDYILKPVSEDQLARCFEKIKKIQSALGVSPAFKATLGKALLKILPQYRTSLIVYERDKVIAVDLKDAVFLYAEKNKCWAVTKSETYSINSTLDQLMPTLDPAVFFRANRQYIIQRHAITAIQVLPFRKLLVTLDGGRETIVISREKKKHFLEWMEGL